jgi:putative phosphonate metabolism protein
MPQAVSPRYAIYWTPDPAGPLAAFGAGWLGHDPALGRSVSRLVLPGINTRSQDAATLSPRRYGLHGTLKPPFALAPGADAAGLESRLATFAAAMPAFIVPALMLADIKGFLALVPSSPCPALHDLADATVRSFDDLRAPAPEAELSRRRKAGLTPRQDGHLVRWGYPYVFEDFAFHLTLTERLDEVTRQRFRVALEPLVAPFCDAPWSVDAISLLRQERPAEPFVLVRRLLLSGARA